MTEEERKAAIEVLSEHHENGTAAAWSLDPARPVKKHGAACYEYEFVSPNGLAGFILDADGIPRPVTGASSRDRVLSVARGWETVHAERRRVAGKRRGRKR